MGEIKREPEPNHEPKPTNPETETENELSPEVIEGIMAKVKNIDSPGLGYTAVREDRVESILENGLLGRNFREAGTGIMGEEHSKITKEVWAKNARKNKDAGIFFNITGTSRDKERKNADAAQDRYFPPKKGIPEKYKTEISASAPFGSSRFSVTGFLFDLSSFKEEEPMRGDRAVPQKNRTFRLDGTPDEEEGVETDRGYILSYRVAPRFLQGVLIGFPEKMPDDNYMAEARRIAELMIEVDKEKKELLVPIYDLRGNLLWPKQMSYDEVKQLAAKHEKK